MRRIVLLTLWLALAAPPVQGEPVDLDREMGQPEKGVEETDQGREKACACCMECMAAMRTTVGKEEGPPQTGGCRECCARCDEKQPLERDVPPEVVR